MDADKAECDMFDSWIKWICIAVSVIALACAAENSIKSWASVETARLAAESRPR